MELDLDNGPHWECVDGSSAVWYVGTSCLRNNIRGVPGAPHFFFLPTSSSRRIIYCVYYYMLSVRGEKCLPSVWYICLYACAPGVVSSVVNHHIANRCIPTLCHGWPLVSPYKPPLWRNKVYNTLLWAYFHFSDYSYLVIRQRLREREIVVLFLLYMLGLYTTAAALRDTRVWHSFWERDQLRIFFFCLFVYVSWVLWINSSIFWNLYIKFLLALVCWKSRVGLELPGESACGLMEVIYRPVRVVVLDRWTRHIVSTVFITIIYCVGFNGRE